MIASEDNESRCATIRGAWLDNGNYQAKMLSGSISTDADDGDR